MSAAPLASNPDDTDAHVPPNSFEPAPEQKRNFWARFGGDGFLVSLGLHTVLVFVALFWVVSKILPEAPKPPDKISTGPGGGSGGKNACIFDQSIKPKSPQVMVRPPTRLIANTQSSITLPEMSMDNLMGLKGGLSDGGLSKGLGNGTGGVNGNSHGMGNDFKGSPLTAFGMRGFTQGGGLIGTFYDLKQTRNRQNSDLGKGYENKAGVHLGSPISECWGFNKVLNTFFKSDWNPRVFDPYFRAPDPLVLSQVYIPSMSAAAAPQAYGVADVVSPRRWVAHYKGNIIAPKSGKIRFTGFGDDVLVVRFNHKNVLDSGYTNPSIDIQFGRGMQRSRQERIYGTNDHFVSEQKGMFPLRCGPWIEVTKGREYPMEAIIAETPGGSFWAMLFLEEAGNNNKPKGKPVLFKVGHTPFPESVKKSMYTDVDLTGGEWIWQPGRPANFRLRR